MFHRMFHREEAICGVMQSRLARWCAGPVLLDAAASDDAEEIAEVRAVEWFESSVRSSVPSYRSAPSAES